MRFVKLAIISFIVFFLLLTGITSLFPSRVIVARAITLDAPKDSIAALIDNFSQWNRWMEGTRNTDYKVVAKDSTHAFFGTVMITLVSKKNNVWSYEWKTRTSLQKVTIQITSAGTGSNVVTWTFEQHVKWYPWEKFGSMMNDKIIGSAIEKSLDNLKMILQNNGNQVSVISRSTSKTRSSSASVIQ